MLNFSIASYYSCYCCCRALFIVARTRVKCKFIQNGGKWKSQPCLRIASGRAMAIIKYHIFAFIFAFQRAISFYFTLNLFCPHNSLKVCTTEGSQGLKEKKLWRLACEKKNHLTINCTRFSNKIPMGKSNSRRKELADQRRRLKSVTTMASYLSGSSPRKDNYRRTC